MTDDDRTPRAQVTLRLERELLGAIDELARDEGVDRTELTRRLLADGLAHRRVETAVADYAAGRRSAWSAAGRAGIDLYEMLDRVAEAGVPYRVDPEALDRLRAGKGTPPSGSGPSRAAAARGRRPRGAASDVATVARLRTDYRPLTVRILFVGESSPAGGTHFYQADSHLYRATREAFGLGLAVPRPPDGTDFLGWFRDLGCWLVDLAEQPVDRSPTVERTRAADAGVPALTDMLRELRPDRVVVVLRRIAPAVRRAAGAAGFDDRAIDVLPFPTRQWRPVYVRQLAGILGEMLGATPAPVQPRAIAETTTEYGDARLHDVMADLLRGRGNGWMKSSAIAREIAAGDLWRRPGDDEHPRASQVSACARQYPELFQTSDLGIRLRRG